MNINISFDNPKPKEGHWYLIIGKKGGVTDAFYKNGEFYIFNCLDPFEDHRKTKDTMTRVSNVAHWKNNRLCKPTGCAK